MDWYPWYFAIYEADAGHLSCLEDGAYRRLIDRYMRTQAPLPDDDAALARFVGLSLDEWLAIAPRIRPFFQARGGKLHNKRCNQELDKQDARSKTRSETARKGGLARQLKYREDSAQSKLSASSKQADGQLKSATGQDKTDTEGAEESRSNTLPLPETPSPPHTRSTRVNGSGREDAASQFEIFWQVYPRREGANPKKPAFKKFAAAIMRGVDPAAIILGAKNYAAEVERQGKAGTQFVAQAVTWLNQERWADHQTASQSNGPPKAGWL
jgi:uncharacterized protein YdaU (DUF1376 family)